MTVYLGKRDFVDHLDHVDPVGELTCYVLSTGGGLVECNFPKSDGFLFLLTDGVILVDPEYLKDRKGRTTLSSSHK